jgi:hypothetical protein
VRAGEIERGADVGAAARDQAVERTVCGAAIADQRRGEIEGRVVRVADQAERVAGLEAIDQRVGATIAFPPSSSRAARSGGDIRRGRTGASPWRAPARPAGAAVAARVDLTRRTGVERDRIVLRHGVEVARDLEGLGGGREPFTRTPIEDRRACA